MSVYGSLFLAHFIKQARLHPRERKDDIMKWKYFSHSCPFVKGIHRWMVDSLLKGTVLLSFDIYIVLNLNQLLEKNQSDD